jgi:hypothetical protein
MSIQFIQPVLANTELALKLYAPHFGLSDYAVQPYGYWLTDGIRDIVTFKMNGKQHIKEYWLTESTPFSIRLYADLCQLQWVDDATFAEWCTVYKATVSELKQRPPAPTILYVQWETENGWQHSRNRYIESEATE